MEARRQLKQEDFCGLVLTYQVNETLLCVPVEHVDSVVEPPKLTDIPGAPDYVMGAFQHHGKTALALSLKKLLRLPDSGTHAKKESLLVVWMGDQPIGYWVDEIKGMTDSGRGHWSAVPALIRDQGITRALVCDGQVYFPLDLTQSSQFHEIFHALETFEKHRVHEVTEEDVERARQQEAALAEQQVAEVVEQPEEIEEVDDYVVADYPATQDLDEGYEEDIETAAFSEHEPEAKQEEAVIDTSILARQMYEARFKEPETELPAEQPELEFNEQGQADAFLDELDEAEPVSIEPVASEASNEAYVDENQIDAFDPEYQQTLEQPQVEIAPLEFNDQGQADAFLALLEESGHMPIETLEVSEDEASNEAWVDENQIDAFDPNYLQSLPQPEEAGSDDDLLITEEPYSFLPSSLPEEDALKALDEALQDEVEEAKDHDLDYEKIFTDEDEEDDSQIALSEEPYSFLPSSLPEDDEAELVEVTDEDEPAPTALLPYKEKETETPEQDQKATGLPDMESTIARADYYADRYVESYADDFEELSEEEKTESVEARKPSDKDNDGFIADIPYELDLDVEEEIEEEAEPETRARTPFAPPMPGGIIIRPDGQISKSFGLVKVFTIVLATSAAGAWWFRDELFHKEQIRKEIPSILQNEIAYLYSERVRIVNPPKGKTRMLVDTPDEEIHVIKRKYVNEETYREGRKKGVKLHRVRRGDTLWAIAEKYLADPYRYPELAENNRIHNPNLIRPGDVVKITVKKTEKKTDKK